MTGLLIRWLTTNWSKPNAIAADKRLLPDNIEGGQNVCCKLLKVSLPAKLTDRSLAASAVRSLSAS